MRSDIQHATAVERQREALNDKDMLVEIPLARQEGISSKHLKCTVTSIVKGIKRKGH